MLVSQVFLAVGAVVSGTVKAEEIDALTAAATTSAPADLVGATTAGQFRVDESGAATYSMAVAAPVGTAGVTPQISLNYSSQQGNGLLGQGWSIGGLSTITRCRQTRVQDGRARAIGWNNDDRFCLDGQRLTLISGSYGSPGSRYKTEIDSYVTVTAVGGTAGHPAYFTVERKDGSVSHYGSTAASKVPGYSGHVFAWSTSQFADSVGNKMTFDYDIAGGHRITSINYAYGSGDFTNAVINFYYQAGIRPDARTAYIGGHPFILNKRLSHITVVNDGHEVRRYNIGYLPVDGAALQNTISKLAYIQECVDTACLAETRFSWTNDETGFASAGSSVRLSRQKDRTTAKYIPADINGDGVQDIVWLEPDWDIGETQFQDQHWYYALGDRRGNYGTPRLVYSNGQNGSEPFPWHMIDHNADGRADLAIYYDGQWRVFVSQFIDGAWALSRNAYSTSLGEKEVYFADINGDGLADAVTGDRILLLQRRPGVPDSSNRAYGYNQQLSYSLESSVPKPPDRVNYFNRTVYKEAHLFQGAGTPDFNGDGRVDLVAYRTVERFQRIDNKSESWTERHYWALVSTDNGFASFSFLGAIDQSVNYGLTGSDIIVADFNGDGLSDAFQRAGVTTGNTLPGPRLTDASLYISNGIEFNPPTRSTWHTSPSVVDYNGDGLLDIIDTSQFAGRPNFMYVKLGTGSDFAEAVTLGNVDGGLYASRQFLDIDGDGTLDHLMFENDRLHIYPGINASKTPRNAIQTITRGLGAETTISYKPLTDTDYYTQISAPTIYQRLNGPWDLPGDSHTLGKTSPVKELLAPIFVVGEFSTSTPSAGAVAGNTDQLAKSTVTYHYGEALVQAGGRGMLGFRTISSVDGRTGVESSNHYRQDFPFTGRLLRSVVRTNNGVVLSDSRNIWKMENWNDGSPVAPYRPYLATNSKDTYGFGIGSSLIQRVVTNNTYDSFGNLTGSEVQTQNGDGTVVEIKTTGNAYGTSLWEREKGRLSLSSVLTVRNGVGQARSSEYTYYQHGPLKGLLHTSVSDQLRPEYKLTTTYQYDALGNKTRVTQSGRDVESRYTRYEYDSLGRYINQTFNSLEHKIEDVVERNALGAPLTIKGLNGAVATREYDVLGREVYRGDNTGAWVRKEYSSCATVNCPVGGKIRIRETLSGGGWRATYMDMLNREIRNSGVGFDGTAIHVDTEYDSLSRVKRTSEPHAGSAQHWTEYEYDVLGRQVVVRLPGVAEPVRINYSGLAAITRNQRGYFKSERENALGDLVEVVDYNGSRITYDYDMYGNLIGTTQHGTRSDPQHVVVAIKNDYLGRKIEVNDPDKGVWTYGYNVFGELIRQTDAKGQTRLMTYDKLGRMKTRIDQRADGTVESNVVWNYDTAANSVGQLVSVEDTVSGYIRAYSYDAIGRRSTISTQLPGTLGVHYERVSYDSLGRTGKLFDAAGDGSWTGHAIEHQYNDHGYLRAVVDAFGSDVYYQVQAMDLRGNVTRSQRGNGVTTERYYTPDTGRLKDVRSALMAGVDRVQDHHYVWDDIGNLTRRENRSGNKNLVEDFSYDALDRLIESKVVGGETQTVVYNSLGNIMSKTGVGDYTYGDGSSSGAGPHAVTATSDGVHYSYDANGNMVSDTAVGDIGGRVLKYTTFDKPYEITKGDHKTEFQYGPDRARYVRIDTDRDNRVKTTRYIGNVEKITLPNGTQQVKRYLQGGVLITLELDSQSNETGAKTQYLYKDHLGSIDVITDAAGVVEQEMSFDAWGQRRDVVNWQSLDIAGLLSFDHSITTRGFTGHEMLDEVGLIHMNGRVYDARLGRFLQADPFVQFPDSTQSYNRYSYVLNGPLVYTDPSGYFSFKSAFKIFSAVVISVVTYGAASTWAAGALAGTSIGCSMTASTLIAGAIGGAAAGFVAGVSSAVFSGAGGSESLRAGFDAALYGGLANGIFGAIGSSYMDIGGKALAHAITGGVLNDLQGSKFSYGFLSAGLSKLANINNVMPNDATTYADTVRAVGAAIVGGTLSDATGGKFANGAITAAFGQIFNGNSEIENRAAARKGLQCFLAGCSSGSAPAVGRSEFTIGDKNFVAIGGTAADRARVQSDLGDIFGTPRGKQMLTQLESRRFLWFFKKDFNIDLTIKNNAYTSPGADTIYLDPNYSPIIQSTAGPITATARRIMAHELGHAVFSAEDDGFRQMNNIIQNENPIMNAFGLPSRTRFEK
ncbi:FG-GAP-like repeat-containing protein [Exilibacterium tricleocarpae]|nr:FG-GAP-like repeat-containing protein [Exilibacterium tricleocarpae]